MLLTNRTSTLGEGSFLGALGIITRKGSMSWLFHSAEFPFVCVCVASFILAPLPQVLCIQNIQRHSCSCHCSCCCDNSQQFVVVLYKSEPWGIPSPLNFSLKLQMAFDSFSITINRGPAAIQRELLLSFTSFLKYLIAIQLSRENPSYLSNPYEEKVCILSQIHHFKAEGDLEYNLIISHNQT